jgi:mannosyltransferase
MDLSLSPGELERARPTGTLTAGRFDASAIATFATLLSAAGAARPSLWFDEAATISAGSRSVPELWRLLGNVDAVHGLYYLLMHCWLVVFPATEFWVRLPSCLAVGVAAAGVVVLGRQFSGRSVAVSAGIVFAILPRITWAGIEARPYALSTACAVWLTVLVVAAARRDRPPWWIGYLVALVGATLVNLFAVLIVLPHAVAVTLATGRRLALARWAGWTLVGLLMVAPFVFFCRTQITQVRWISRVSPATLLEIGYEQYFDRSAAFAVVTALILAATLMLR